MRNRMIWSISEIIRNKTWNEIKMRSFTVMEFDGFVPALYINVILQSKIKRYPGSIHVSSENQRGEWLLNTEFQNLYLHWSTISIEKITWTWIYKDSHTLSGIKFFNSGYREEDYP